MSKLNQAVFKPKFGTYWDKIKPLFTNGTMDKIYGVLKEESSKGVKIVPDSADVFRAFLLTPIQELKAVIMAYCPYHQPGIADGLCLSCSKTGMLQPSLEKWYEAIEFEFNDGMCLKCEKNPDLSFLAQQGALMLNSALTTREGEPGAHQELWEPFTKYVLEEIISLTSAPVVFLGQQARAFSGLIEATNPVYELTHPSFAARNGTRWDSGRTFRKVKEHINKTNNYELFWDLSMDDLPF
jgi:uracil-DNA glycosylase